LKLPRSSIRKTSTKFPNSRNPRDHHSQIPKNQLSSQQFGYLIEYRALSHQEELHGIARPFTRKQHHHRHHPRLILAHVCLGSRLPAPPCRATALLLAHRTPADESTELRSYVTFSSPDQHTIVTIAFAPRSLGHVREKRIEEKGCNIPKTKHFLILHHAAFSVLNSFLNLGKYN